MTSDLCATFDVARASGAARMAAHNALPSHLSSWFPDVVQDVLLAVWADAQTGQATSAAGYQWAARDAVRRLFGDKRRPRRFAATSQALPLDVLDEPGRRQPANSPIPLHLMLAFARLQAKWSGLSDSQRQVVDGVLSGMRLSEIARVVGTSRAWQSRLLGQVREEIL